MHTDHACTRADARRNHDRLLDAAREEFAARGSAASMEDVARRAGVGVGTLYRHFPRRIDLVEAVYAVDVQTLADAADAALAEADPFVGLTSWLQAFVTYAEAKRALLNELHEAFERNPDLKVALREQLRSTAERVLDRARTAGAVRPDLTAADLLQLVGGMCMSATSAPGQNARLLTYVLAGIRTDA